MTVGKLIELLKLSDPNEPIVFQFLLHEHVELDYSAEEFEAIADHLEDSDSFGDDTARVLKDWLARANEVLEEEGLM
jgi:hypothetical protein